MNDAPSPLSPAELGSLLQKAKAEVLRTFVERVRAEVPGARRETRAYLEDELGDVLDELGAYIESDGRPRDLVESLQLAKSHGLQRARGQHYGLDDLRHEYRILRAILFSFMPAERTLSARTALLFGEAFELCASRSTEAFLRASATELGAHRDLLAAHEALRESEAALKFTLASAKLGTWSVDLAHGSHLQLSDETARMFGLGDEHRHTRVAIDDFIHSADRERVARVLSAAITSGAPYADEYRIVRPNGEVRWIESRGRARIDASGVVQMISGVILDVTERKHAAARERRTLEEVLEQTTVPTALLIGPSHVFTFANTAYCDTFSLDRSIVGRSVSDVLPDAVEQGFGRLLTRVFTTGEKFVGQEVLFERRTDDGRTTPIYVDLTYAAKRDAEGAIEGVLATAVDVTDRVVLRKKVERANEDLRAEKFNLDQIVQITPAAMATFTGPDLVVDRVNPNFAAIYGNRPLLGRPLMEACPELVGQGFDELMHRVMSTGEPVTGAEALAKIALEPGSDQTVDRYYDFKFAPLKDEQGRPYGVYDFSFDVTARVLAKRAKDVSEAKLREAEHQLQRAIQVAKIGFYTLDLESNQVTYSTQMQLDWGIEPTSTLPEVLLFIHPDDRDRVVASIGRTIESGKRFVEEYRITRPTDGALVWIEAQGEIVVDETTQQRRWFGTSLDITERKRNEETLKAASLEARHANVAKSAFLANMSHEIRTPLGAVMGFAELLRNPELSSSELLNFVAVIERNSQHLLRIVDDILDLSKVEAGKMLFEHIEFSLPALISDFTSLMAYRAREKAIEFSLRFDSAIPDLILSDPTRLRQILNNVVGNAIKFTERGSVELCVRFDRTKLTLAVRDTGRGLTKDQAERLFQAFVQADESTTRQFGGTGLGLVLTKRLANAMGGDFVLERSEPGVGSTFTASIVVEVSPRAKITRPTSRHASEEAARLVDKRRLHDMRVLVVDDSPDNRTLLGTMLRKVGAIVEVASDGAEGVAMALSKRYDAILMDIQMPRLDGYQALERLKDSRHSTPVVALTAHAMVEERARAEGKGFFAFLSKPIRSELLLELLDDVKRRGTMAPVTTPRSGRLAMLVEDDGDSRALLESIIRKRGFDVVGAADGAQALAEIAAGCVPDLVLLDLSLPDMSGGDIIQAIRANPALATTKIIVVSGWDNLAQRARDLGADDALPKPIELPRLKTILSTMFEG